MLRKFFKELSYFPGFKTKGKYILFMSDDWGSLRVESSARRESLMRNGIDMDSNRFDRYDCLESPDDLNRLFDVLMSLKDSVGAHPIITPQVNVANPDFEKIKGSDYKDYYYETIGETYRRYSNENEIMNLYSKGISNSIFIPQFHGREHLNIDQWLKSLQDENGPARKAFHDRFFMLSEINLCVPSRYGLGAAYDISDKSGYLKHEEIIGDGLKIFRDIFKYSSNYMTPPSGIISDKLDEFLIEREVQMLDVPRARKIPAGNNRFYTRYHYLGQRGTGRIIYITRNAVFEPNLNHYDDGVDGCLKEIETAFKWGKPAIISNHRAAFIGGIEVKNRDKGLFAIRKLFKSILKKWPDVNFISTDHLLRLIINE